MIPKTIIQYWDTESVPDEIQALLDSWKNSNPEFTYKLYNKEDAISYIQENYGAFSLDLFNGAKLPAMQSDIFRVAYCLKEGGVYVDAATKCNGAIFPLIKDESNLVLMKKWHGGVWNGFIATPPGSTVLFDIWTKIQRNVFTKEVNKVWRASGPGVYAEVLSGDGSVAPTMIEQKEMSQYFNPINDLVHKKEMHWSNVQKRESIYQN